MGEANLLVERRRDGDKVDGRRSAAVSHRTAGCVGTMNHNRPMARAGEMGGCDCAQIRTLGVRALDRSIARGEIQRLWNFCAR